MPPKFFLPSAPYGASQATNALTPSQPAAQNPQTPLLPPNFTDPGTMTQKLTQPAAGQANPFSGSGGMPKNPFGQMFRRGLFGAMLLLFLTPMLWATTTVTGTIQNLGTGAVGSNAFVRFWLRGCAGNQPRVNGTSIIGPTQGGVFFFDLAASASGTISGTLYSTRDSTGLLGGDIECGGVKTSVWYGMQVWVGGKAGPEVPVHAKNTATLDVSNVTPIATNPVVTAPTGDSTYLRLDGGNNPLSTLTVSGAATLAQLNGKVYSDQQVGATLDVRLNACITAAIALPPHICDATGEGGTQTIAAQVNVGQHSPAKAVTLLLPSFGPWNITITDGVSCGIEQFDGSSIVGQGPVTGLNLNITGSASANLKAFYCTDPAPVGGGQYVRAEGFQLYNPNGSTVTTALADAEKTYDNSLFSRITIANYSVTDGLRVYGACCGTTFSNITSNSNGTGKRPVFIQADASARNHDVNFYSLSADHPGSGFASVEISGGPVSLPADGVNSGINFYGLFTEETTTNPNFGVKVVDARGINIFGWEHNNLTGGATATALDISQSAANSVRAINVSGLHFVGASGTGINNHITGKTFLTSTGYVKSYTYGGATSLQPSIPEASEDLDHVWYDALGNAVYNFPTSAGQGGAGNATIRNSLDSALSVSLDSGLTAAQEARLFFKDRGVAKWELFKDPLNAVALADNVNGVQRFYIPAVAAIATGGGIFHYANLECPAAWLNNAGNANIALCKDANDSLTYNGVPVAGIFTKANVTPVTSNTNTAADQNGMAITVTAGALNSLNRTLLIQLAGVYSTPAASTSVITDKLKLCSVSGCGSGTVVTLATWTTTALGGIQATNDPFNCVLNASTQTAGASAAFEAHGNLTIDLAALATAAESVFADGNTATVGTIDSTAQLFLQHTKAFSNASASNSFTDRQMIADTVD